MASVLPEFLDVEFRRSKRLARLVLLLVLMVPMYRYAPLIWKDGSYDGRWVFAADIEERPLECKGIPYFLQSCTVRVADRLGNRFVTLNYLVVATDWSDSATDIVRSSQGHLTGAIGVTGPGLLTRFSALFCVCLLGFAVEWILKRMKYLSLQNRITGEGATPRRRDAVMLSRDRRDHF
jgi:hypothetical protein